MKNDTAVDIFVCKYLSHFAGRTSRGGNAGTQKCIFYILIENLQFAFQEDIPNLNTQKEYMEVIVFLPLPQDWMLSI